MSHESTIFAKAAKSAPDGLIIVPIITTDTGMSRAAALGHARTYTEALRLVRGAGYRVMTVGGCHEPSPHDDDEFFITVY